MAGLAARNEAEILETIDRQMRKACPWQRTGGVVDHQMVCALCVMPASAKAVGPATRKAREEVKSSIWLTLGGLDTLAGAEQVDRLLREIESAFGRNQDQGAAAIGHEAALQ
jgi:hypothetical protein